MIKHTKTHGFTLIELMITISVLSILALIAYPSLDSYILRSRMDNARSVMIDVIQYMERQYAQKKTFCDTPPTTTDGTCSKSLDISGITQNSTKYTISFQEVKASSYVLVATPVNDGSSASKFLDILYDSQTATFARCNSKGFAQAKANNDPENNCEVF